MVLRHVGTERTLVHYSLYTGCMYRVLTPRELKNQVVNLQNIATRQLADKSILTAKGKEGEKYPAILAPTNSSSNGNNTP